LRKLVLLKVKEKMYRVYIIGDIYKFSIRGRGRAYRMSSKGKPEEKMSCCFPPSPSYSALLIGIEWRMLYKIIRKLKIFLNKKISKR
jgi:hypothetical protein